MTDPETTPDDAAAQRDGGSAAVRILDLLQLVAASERPLTLSEIGDRLALPKPTVHRLCARLEALNYLTREPGGRHFRIGPALSRLGFDAVRNDGLRGERRAVLSALMEAVGETCNLTVLAGREVLYLDRVECRWPLRLQLEPGSRVPIHCTASGKLFLAHLPPHRLERLLAHLELTAYTERSITDRARLIDELERIRDRGYSLDAEEFLVGLNAIAVPVRDTADRGVVAAIACHGPSARLSLARAVAALPQLTAAATRMAATLPQP